MAYYPTFQPSPYQDQLNQLRTANPMPMQGFPPMQARPDPGGLNWVQGEAGAAKPQESTQTANFVTVDEFNEFKTEVLNRLSEPVEVSLSRKKKGVNADE